MKTKQCISIGCLAAFWVAGATIIAAMPHPRTDVYDGWRLGTQAWSFNRFTFFEAVDKTRDLGLNWIQAYPGQRIAPDIDAQMGFDLPDAIREQIKSKLAEANVSIVAFGVVGVPRDEPQARRLFEFAKAMGIEVIVSEPAEDQFDLIDKLCQEYEIKLVVHNHPKPSYYWNPDTVLKVIEGRSKWVGACTDVGHWVRSGLDPIDCLKKLKGRINDVHIKEIDTNLGHDVVWGTAQGRVKGILEELHRQGYRGTFAIEYEHSWDNNVPLIRQCIAYYNKVAATLNPTGWKELFAPDLSNADFEPGSWEFKDGVLELKGGGDLWTKAKYSDFVLDFDFKVGPRSNSGIFLRAANHEWLPWVEVQIGDTYGQDISRHICGALFDVQAPTVNAVKPAGQWNRMTIWAQGPKIKVALNNQVIVDVNLNDWTEAGKNPDGSRNKFDIAYKDLPRSGFLGFQDHRDGSHVWYRNLKIKEL
ncbi:MAG: DUF1080 domain-containing protein [Planctomycetes bacterium]|nr:DUF1080 domain-containing protein [Planctomycetota bacterium]